MAETFKPERRNNLRAFMRHLRMMLDDHDKPARFCRREIEKLCRRLARLNIISR